MKFLSSSYITHIRADVGGIVGVFKIGTLDKKELRAWLKRHNKDIVAYWKKDRKELMKGTAQ